VQIRPVSLAIVGGCGFGGKPYVCEPSGGKPHVSDLPVGSHACLLWVRNETANALYYGAESALQSTRCLLQRQIDIHCWKVVLRLNQA